MPERRCIRGRRYEKRERNTAPVPEPKPANRTTAPAGHRARTRGPDGRRRRKPQRTAENRREPQRTAAWTGEPADGGLPGPLRGNTSGGSHRRISLFQIRREESLDAIERNGVRIIVQIRMIGAGNDQQLLVAALQTPERILAEVARMGLFAVNEQHGAADLVAVGQQGRIEERQRRGRIPPSVVPRGVL